MTVLRRAIPLPPDSALWLSKPVAQASSLRYPANKKRMHMLGEKNEFGKEKTFSYKRPRDH